MLILHLGGFGGPRINQRVQSPTHVYQYLGNNGAKPFFIDFIFPPPYLPICKSYVIITIKNIACEQGFFTIDKDIICNAELFSMSQRTQFLKMGTNILFIPSE